MRKRIISLITAILLLIAVMPVTANAATALTLTKTVVGNTGAIINVSGGSGTVTAESGNTDVAEVSVSGTQVTVTGVEGKKGVATITVTRGASTASIEVAVGYTAFHLDGRSVTVYPGSDTNYEVVGIEQASETEFTGAEGTGEMTVTDNGDGSTTYTVASGYELSISIKKKGGIYEFTGSSNYAGIAVKKEATKDATLLFDGLNLKSQFTSALTVKKDSTAKVYVYSMLGTVNTLADSAVNNADTYGPTADGGDGSNQYYAESAVIKGKTASDITLAGTGTLNVVASAKNGVKVGANAHLTVEGCNLNVNAINSALSTENEMLIASGTLTLTTTDGDALKAADDTDTVGVIYITGGNITINSSDEGILARDSVYISDGTVNVTSAGDGIKAENADATAGNINISGGSITINSTGDGISGFYNNLSGGTYNITCANGYTNTSYNGDTDSSAKCIKAELENNLSGGTYTLSAPDDAIHSDGDITFEGGTYSVRSRDDGVHSDQVLTFGVRGASDDILNVTVNNSYEGFEGADIILNSGHATVYSTDDVINAANKDLSNYHFTINEYGGVYRLYTSGGDGVDSNGGCYFRGGDLEVFSSSNTSNDPLDTEDTLALYGGVTLGCGMNQMQGSPSAGIYVEFTNLSIYTGNSIVIKDSSGNVLKSTTAYFSSSSNRATYIVFSHPALVSGNTYYCYINGSSSAKTGTATGAHADNTTWTDLDAGDTDVYERVTSMNPGSRYIITNASAATSVSTLGGGSGVSAVQSTLSSVSGGYSFGTVGENNTWHIDDSGHIYATVSGVDYYLNYTASSSYGWSTSYTLGVTTDVSSAASWSVGSSGSAATVYATVTSSGGPGGPGGGWGGPGGQSTKLYLYYSSGWKLSTSSATCYIYAPAVEQAALTGSLYYVAEVDEDFGMSDIQAGTSISYRSSRSAAAEQVAWSSSHVTYSWEPAYDNTVSGTYVLTVCYDGIAIGTVTVRLVGSDQSVIVNFIGDYVGQVELAVGDTLPLPEAPDGYVYTYFRYGINYDVTQPVTESMTITVVMESLEEPIQFLLGDINFDGRVDFLDVSLLSAFLMNSTAFTADQRGVADVNGDGNIDVLDLPALYSLALSSN